MAHSNKYYLKNRESIIKKVRERQDMLSGQGLCVVCGEKVDTGYKRCPKHLKLIREANRKHDEYKYANGICKGCSKPLDKLPVGTLRYCADCAVKQAEAKRVSTKKSNEYDNLIKKEWEELVSGK